MDRRTNKNLRAIQGVLFILLAFVLVFPGCKTASSSDDSSSAVSQSPVSVEDSLELARQKLDQMRPKLSAQRRQPSEEELRDKAEKWTVEFPNGESFEETKYTSNHDIYAGALRPSQSVVSEIARIMSGVEKQNRSDELVNRLLKVIRPWALPLDESEFTYQIHYDPNTDTITYAVISKKGIMKYVATKYYSGNEPYREPIPPGSSLNGDASGYLSGRTKQDPVYVFLNQVRPWFDNAVKSYYLANQSMPSTIEELLAHFRLKPNRDFPELWDNLTYYTDGNFYASLTFSYQGSSYTVEVDLSQGIKLPWWRMTYVD